MRQPSHISDRFTADWLAGYRAALADLDRALSALGAQEDALSPVVKARLRAQLLQIEANRAA
jgi:hypothetical protein